MHVVISWDIKADGSKWESINKELKSCLTGYSWVKPLTTLYIVRIDTNEERNLIKEALVGVCKNHPSDIHLVVSPAIQSGKYGGWLPKALWPKVRERTEV